MPSRLQRAARAAIGLAFGLAAPVTLPAADPVAFTFAWPSGLDAGVEFVHRQMTKTGDREDESTIEGSYDMRATALGADLEIAFENVEVTVPKSGGRLENRVMHFMALAATTSPDFVVDAQGKLVSIGSKALRKDMNGTFRKLKSKLPSRVQKQVERVLRRMVEEDRLTSMARGAWDQGVEQWNGRSLAPGGFEKIEREQSVPMLDGATLPMTITIGIAELASCPDGGAPDGCALVRIESKLESSRLTPAHLETLRAIIPGSPPPLDPGNVTLSLVAEVLTEPARLVPHRIDATQRLAVAASADGSNPAFERTDTQEIRFTYR